MAKKKLINKNSVLYSMIISLTIGLLSQLILISTFAFFIVKSDPTQEIYKYFWIIIFVIPCILSGFIIAKLKKSKGYLWGAIISLILVTIQLVIIILLNSFQLNNIIPISVFLSIILGSLSGIIGANLR